MLRAEIFESRFKRRGRFAGREDHAKVAAFIQAAKGA
jgi:hypothetical protein